jgi:hypothetical protein
VKAGDIGGKEFGMESGLFGEPTPKINGTPNDLLVIVLRDGQPDVMIGSRGL